MLLSGFFYLFFFPKKKKCLWQWVEPFISSLQKRKPSQILHSCQYKRARCKVSSEVSGAALKLREHRGPTPTLHHGALMGKQRVWHWCFQAREQAGASRSWRFETNVKTADIRTIRRRGGKPWFRRSGSRVSNPKMTRRRKTRNLSAIVWDTFWNKMLGQFGCLLECWQWLASAMRTFSQHGDQSKGTFISSFECRSHKRHAKVSQNCIGFNSQSKGSLSVSGTLSKINVTWDLVLFIQGQLKWN